MVDDVDEVLQPGAPRPPLRGQRAYDEEAAREALAARRQKGLNILACDGACGVAFGNVCVTIECTVSKITSIYSCTAAGVAQW